MAVTAFGSAITGPLLSDPDTSAMFEDSSVVKAMLAVEGALARAQARCDMIPDAAAARISEICETLDIPPAALADGTARDGMPIPALVALLRQAVGPEAAGHVHFGATSQDIIDTALILRLQKVLALHETALGALAGHLARLTRDHRATAMAARTRMQQASPTSFGLKAAVWLSAVLRHLDRLQELRRRSLVVSLAGAAGTMAALGPRALDVEAVMSRELGLGIAGAPWHVMRDGLYDIANWLVLVSGTLGKIGEDLCLLAQNEVGEIRLGGGGGSSTLPNKANPIAAETLVTLARHNAGALGTLHQGAVQAQERGGAGWTLEWTVLPQIAIATGAALAHGTIALAGLKVDTARMRANIDATNGLMLAEAASFALSAHLPRAEAQAMVKQACRRSIETGDNLFDILPALLTPALAAALDWDRLRDPVRHLGQSDALIDRVLESYQALAG